MKFMSNSANSVEKECRQIDDTVDRRGEELTPGGGDLGVVNGDFLGLQNLQEKLYKSQTWSARARHGKMAGFK